MRGYTKEDIVKAAINIIAKEGVQGLTIKNLAARLGFSEGAMYRHFGSKQDLLSGVLDYFDNVADTTLQKIKEYSEPLPRLRAFFAGRIQLFAEWPELGRVMMNEETFRYYPELSDRMLKIMHKHRQELSPDLQKLIPAGKDKAAYNESDLFRIIFGSLRLLVTQWNLSGNSFNLVKEGDRLWRALQYLIAEEK